MKVHYLAWMIFSQVLLASQSIAATQANGTVHLNGIAQYAELNKVLYSAAIYTGNPTSSAADLLTHNGPMRMEIRVTAEKLFRRKFRQMWLENIASNSPKSVLDQQTPNIMIFADVLNINLIKGDVLAIASENREGLEITLNGTPLASIEDPRFFNVLLKSWVGDVPPSTQFRESLLQGGKIRPELLASFSSIRPSTARAESIGSSLVAISPDALARAKQAPSSPPAPEVVANVQTAPAVSAAPVSTTSVSTTSVPTPSLPASELLQASQPVDTNISEVPAVLSITESSITDQAKPALEPKEQIIATLDERVILQQQYIEQLRGWASRFIEYPYAAMEDSVYGTLTVEVVVDRDGNLIRSAISRTSGYQVLDTAALQSLEAATPFPEIPQAIVFDEFSFNLPVVFTRNQLTQN